MKTGPLLRSVYKEVTGKEEEAVCEALCQTLSSEDAAILTDTLHLLGRSDAGTQAEQIKNAIERLRVSIAAAREKCPVEERLSLTMGISFGVCLVILLL